MPLHIAAGMSLRPSSLVVAFCGILLLDLLPSAVGKCPNWCSQSGICTGPGDDAFCICEMGYKGDDCATRLCPKGDDPLTTGQADRAFMIRTTADGGLLGGELIVTFNGETTTLDANAHRTGDLECVSALQALPNIEQVSCRRGPVSEFGGAEYLISISRFPTMPWENNHYGHDGNPSLNAFSCNISNGGGGGGDGTAMFPSCDLIDVVTENVKEYAECSRHGTCVRETGRCECSFGFGGEACDDISDSDDAQVILAEGPFFTGSTLKLRANRDLSSEFDLIRAIAGPKDVMTLTGTGDLILHEGALHIQPPPTYGSSSSSSSSSSSFSSTSPRRAPAALWGDDPPPRALGVSGGSLGVTGGGAEISSTRANAPALSISVGLPVTDIVGGSGGGAEGQEKKDAAFFPSTTSRRSRDEETSFSYSGVALSVNVREARDGRSPDRFRLLELSVGGGSEEEMAEGEDEWAGAGGGGDGGGGGEAVSVLSVRGDGQVTMAGGGGLVLEEGDLVVSSGDAKFQEVVSVGDALTVGPGGVSVADGGGVRVFDGGFEARLTSPTTLSTLSSPATWAAATLAAADTGNAGDGQRSVSSTAAVGVLSASHHEFSGDVLRVDASGEGAASAGAVLVRASSAGQDVFEIAASGATSIKAGGLDVQAGGLRVGSGGATVSSGGLTIDGGLRLRSGTLVIEDDGDGDGGGGGGGGGRNVGFEVAHGGIRATSSEASTPALAASAVARGFGGSVLSVSAPSSSPSDSFLLLQATVGGNSTLSSVEKGGTGDDSSSGRSKQQNVFTVDGAGRVSAAGGLDTGVEGAVVAGGGLVSKGSTVLEQRRAIRDVEGDVRGGGLGKETGGGRGGGGEGGVEVDASLGTFFEVPDDGREGSANVLRIKGGATPGQMLVLRNSDADPTSGAAVIPPGFTVFFIHDGISWRDVRALEAAVRDLTGVTSLTAAADLDIGDFTLKARHLVSSGNKAGGLALYGGGGLLTSDAGLSWDSQSGTLTVPRLHATEVADGMDFKGKPARNVALVNATIDGIPFLKTTRLMLETAAVTKSQDVGGGGVSSSGGMQKSALAAMFRGPDSGIGLAAFDRKGELVRVEGAAAWPGGILDVAGLGPHAQIGDVDFQGYTARNISLSGVSRIAGLERLEVGELFLSISSPESTPSALPDGEEAKAAREGTVAIVTSEGRLRSAGGSISVDSATGTFQVPRIGAHEVVGDVDFLGNGIRNAVLESPNIRGAVPSIHASELKVSAQPSVSRGFVAVFSSFDDESDTLAAGLGAGGASGKRLGLAAGGGGLAWRDGALQDVSLAGTTTFEGDIDLRGHRLLNFDMETRDFDDVEELTIRRTLKLDEHASSPGALLSIGAEGSVGPADPATLSLHAASAVIAGPSSSGGLTCRGAADIGGTLAVAGGVSISGVAEFSGGIDAQGTRIKNAQLKNAIFEGIVGGDMELAGGLRVGALKNAGGGMVVAAAESGELKVTKRLGFDEEKGVFMPGKLSGHEVTGTVDFGGQALLSPALDFSAGGGVNGLSSLSVGGAGLDVSGVLTAASDVIVEGSVTVAGAVMGRGPYMDTSDSRMKENVRSISAVEASSAVRRLRAITYELKPDAFPTLVGGPAQSPNNDRPQLGFIAQEVEAVAPEVVSEDARGFKVVAYSRLVPLLTSALSAALDRLDKLEHAATTAAAAAGTSSATATAITTTPLEGGGGDGVGVGVGVGGVGVGGVGGGIGDGVGFGGSGGGGDGDSDRVSVGVGFGVGGVGGVGDGGSGGVVGETLEQRRLTMEVDEKGQQARDEERGGAPKTGTPKPEMVYDLIQVWVENTALRSRVNELEERMAGLERKLGTSG